MPVSMFTGLLSHGQRGLAESCVGLYLVDLAIEPPDRHVRYEQQHQDIVVVVLCGLVCLASKVFLLLPVRELWCE